MKKVLNIIKKIILGIVIIILTVLFGILGLSIFVKLSVKKKIITIEEASKLESVDCIVVLGASVKNGNTPSAMLSDRLNKGIELYDAGVSDRLLMSGDRSSIYYDEVSVMKNYAIEKGVNSSDIFVDPAGFSTYDSMYRAKEIYGSKKVVIVTQRYHLYRALYIARKLGIDAYGVAAEDIKYSGDTKRYIREILAIDKDFFKVIYKPEPVKLGEKISLSGDGNQLE